MSEDRMTTKEAADIVAAVSQADAGFAGSSRQDQQERVASYLQGARGWSEIGASIMASRVLDMIAPSEPDPLAGAEAEAEERTSGPDPLSEALAGIEPDPLAVVDAPRATQAITRITRRKARGGDNRLRPGRLVPGLLKEWMQAANLSDGEAAKMLGISERMTVYNMRMGKQRQVLDLDDLKIIRADVTKRLDAYKSVLKMLADQGV